MPRRFLKPISGLLWVVVGSSSLLAAVSLFALVLTNSKESFSQFPLLSQSKILADSYKVDYENFAKLCAYVATVSVPAMWLWSKAVKSSTADPSDLELDKQRNKLRNKVEKSLGLTYRRQHYLEHFIELTKEPCPHYLKAPNSSVPTDTNIFELFENADGKLLILGGAGTGKSTTLDALAWELVDRAKNDSQAQIPVVLNLSSWNGLSQTLDDWLVEELKSKHDIDRGICRVWLRTNELILILDALDEIPLAEDRKTCLSAINNFRDEHSSSIVVSSREPEYDSTGIKLDLKAAIRLKPLEKDQIDVFLRKFGNNGEMLLELFG